jgi:hypothetical protein
MYTDDEFFDELALSIKAFVHDVTFAYEGCQSIAEHFELHEKYTGDWETRQAEDAKIRHWDILEIIDYDEYHYETEDEMETRVLEAFMQGEEQSFLEETYSLALSAYFNGDAKCFYKCRSIGLYIAWLQSYAKEHNLEHKSNIYTGSKFHGDLYTSDEIESFIQPRRKRRRLEGPESSSSSSSSSCSSSSSSSSLSSSSSSS